MKKILILCIIWSSCNWVAAQVTSGCPGFRNPTSFNTGNSTFFWSARVGERTYTPGDVTDTTTGYHIMSTCTTAPDIIGHSNITSTAHDSGPDLAGSGCGHTFFDANGKRFQIIGPANAGIDQFTISPGSDTGMTRIPPGYTHSIRLGDMRSTGQAVPLGETSMTPRNNKGAEALFYTMQVNPSNSLLIINYAIVARRFSHSAYDAGEFLIRVVKKNDDGTWPNAPINDSLWYKVSAPTFEGSEMPAGWEVGAGNVGAWPCTYAYKPWSKVAINLNNYLYEHVRIEMYTSDCIYSADPIYAYISGDYQSLLIHSSGCSSAQSETIDSLWAPEGLISYSWYVATEGYETDIYNFRHMDSIPMRQVSPPSASNLYTPVLQDFIVSQGPHAGDTLPIQTFMCVMTSALDPSKPFLSKLYTNVENLKPIARANYTSDCDLHVQFTDQSGTFGNTSVAPDSTRWIVYSDTLNSSVLDTLWGPNPSYRFPDQGYYNVTLRVKTFGHDCGSESTFVCHALRRNPVDIVLSDSIVCESEETMAWCAESCHMDKVWHIGDSVLRPSSQNSLDTIRWTPRVGFTTLQLTTYTDSLCPATTSTTITTYGPTRLSSSADRHTLCQGDSVTLHAEGLASLRWVSVPYDSVLGEALDRNTVTVAPHVSTSYSVYPTQPNRCIQNAAAIDITVYQYPQPTVWTHLPYVDISDPMLIIEDRSTHTTSSQWSFSDGTTDEGRRVEHRFGTSGDSVSIALRTCNYNLCCTNARVSIPVKTIALWIPNTFIPADPQNSTFAITFTMPVLKFELWIYNRWGLLVHHSTDINHAWDGNTSDGTPCPQGSYAYYFEYILADYPDRRQTGVGTVTLLR